MYSLLFLLLFVFCFTLLVANIYRDCARLLVSFHSMAGNGEEKVVYIKYSDPEKGAVAMLPPAKNLMPEGSDSQ